MNYAAWMTYDEFLRQLGKAGISVREFTDLIAMNRNSVSNYRAKGSVPTHLAVIATLLAEMAEHGVDYRAALSVIDIEPKRPRGAGGLGKFGGSRQGSLELDGLQKGRADEQH